MTSHALSQVQVHNWHRSGSWSLRAGQVCGEPPHPTQSQDRSLPGATHRGAPCSSSPPPLTSSSLRKVLFSFFPARKFPLKKRGNPPCRQPLRALWCIFLLFFLCTYIHMLKFFSMHIYYIQDIRSDLVFNTLL